MAQITLRDYLKETEDAVGSHQVEKALANCQSILAYFPDSLEGQRLLGEVYLAQGRLEDAQHAFDWVLSNDPENVVAYCSRALVSESQSDYDTALDCYQQAYELSRGNSQIRQAFNILSERIGQQGFMLSRAGLARLYMHGDLLAQSIQEWDVVLAAMPDRLDARTGLLEAYWREGFYDQASQLANQILQDVPGCLKALILLAHVTAPQDMLQSQELMKRAEALDPDLVMAHTLFADHIASQSRDPFLKLLKRSPVVIGEDITRSEIVKGLPTQVESSMSQERNHTYAPNSDALATWGNIEGWSNETTLSNSRSNGADQQAAPSFANWNVDPGSHADDILQNLRQGVGSSDSQWGMEAASPASWSAFQQDTQAAPSSNRTTQPEPWQLLQNALNNINSEVVWNSPSQNEPQQEARPAYDDAFPSQPAQESHEHLEEAHSRISDDMRTIDTPVFAIEENDPPFSMQEENDPLAPPAWLSMLTQTERNQLSGVMPVINLAEQQPAAQQPQTVAQPKAELAHDNVSWSPSISSDAGEGDAGEEVSFFGPDWLKSLGAATLENDQADEVSMATSPQAPSETPGSVKPQKEVYEAPRITQQEQTQSGAADEQWAASSLLQQLDQPKRGSWLDSLSSSPAFEQYEEQETSQQPWESSFSIGTQSGTEYSGGNERWEESRYEANAQQNGENGDSSTHFKEPETEEAQEPWSVQAPQDQPNRGSWLDSLSSSPTFEQYEEQEPSRKPWENGLSSEAQPEVEQEEREQSSRETWSSPRAEQEQAQPSWLSQMSELQTPSRNDTWQPLPVEAQPQANEQSEQNLVTTLEELEQKLRSRGFIPLEPNSLSAIAQTQNNMPSAEDAPHYDAQRYGQDPSLSSALAELGNFIQPSSERPNGTPQPSTASEQPDTEPSWRAVPEPDKAEVEATSASKQAAPAMESVRSYETQDARQQKSVSPQPTISPARPEVTFSPAFEATEPLAARNQNGVLQEAAARMNPLLDNELETTMKRPAVRLQPMQRRTLPSRDLQPQSRGRAAEPAVSNAGNGNSGFQERLLRGYQSQLIGDYDNAMQEYRVIIRNTPELLGEVVSNLRALLKLAPKYSAGYRVLGDAYMRQGEYLQAMEAYNKALTMAKKAKN